MSQPSPLEPARQHAQVLARAGDLGGARAALEHAVAVGRVNLGQDDPDLLDTMRALARIDLAADDPSGARRVLEEAYAAGSWRLGDAAPVMVLISHDLGVVAEELGNRHEARKAFGRVAGAGADVLGAEHWAVARARAYLGAEAAAALEEADTPPFGLPIIAPGAVTEQAPGYSTPQAYATTADVAQQGIPGPPPIPETGQQRQPEQGGAGQHSTAAVPDPPMVEGRQQRTPEPGGAGPRLTTAATDPPTVEGRQQRTPEPGGAGPRLTTAATDPPTVEGGQQRAPEPGGAGPHFTAAATDPPMIQTGQQWQPGSGGAGPYFAAAAADPPRVGGGQEWSPGAGPYFTAAAPDPPRVEGGRRRQPGAGGAGPYFAAAVPDPGAYGRRAPALFAAIAAVLAAVIAVIALVVVLAQRGGGGGESNVPTLGGGPAPGDVRLRDSGSSVQVSWSDPANGTTSFIVSGGHPGEVLKPMGQVSPGQTSFALNGLNADLDYCFAVVAVYSSKDFSSSPQACTRRTDKTPRPSTT